MFHFKTIEEIIDTHANQENTQLKEDKQSAQSTLQLDNAQLVIFQNSNVFIFLYWTLLGCADLLWTVLGRTGL